MDQNHNQPEKSTDENAGIRRSYECTFCKRGFTNAQALGGHMNIHRKDKDKAKSKSKHKSQEEASNKAIENHSNPRYAPPIQSADHHHQQKGFVGQQNYQLFLPSPNPSYRNENYLPVRRPDCLDAGLSLTIGKPSLPDDRDDDGKDGHSNVKENEVDLELRLGHDP